MDYKKFLYNQREKKRVKGQAKKKKLDLVQIQTTMILILNLHTQKFLNEGSKVKAFVFFRGRTIVFKDRGEILRVLL